MQKERVFWDYFQATGRIGAYLLYKEISRRYCFSTNSLEIINKKARKLG